MRVGTDTISQNNSKERQMSITSSIDIVKKAQLVSKTEISTKVSSKAIALYVSASYFQTLILTFCVLHTSCLRLYFFCGSNKDPLEWCKTMLIVTTTKNVERDVNTN
jgi:hypothetical protein